MNLFKGLAAALHLRPGRRVILADAANFPTDSYMAQGLAALVRGQLRLAAQAPPVALRTFADPDILVVDVASR